ncbi:peptide-methionine (S)-S-oxide reductase MsrA [Sulfobacillus thermotolerans]|uniref:peptide-methionine (S)-S-oxide reductase MsrA n=1 Tax=Sulfobacillus thermotolerans TaxID=338644 RepID=UPI003368471A
MEQATFAGGCFWCMVHPFDQWPGVLKVVSGYTGGHSVNPTYEDVCAGHTGHYEAVNITFDPAQITYAQLLDIYWQQIDPTDSGGQFYDRGPSYKPAIFYHSPEQKRLAEQSRDALDASGRFNAQQHFGPQSPGADPKNPELRHTTKFFSKSTAGLSDAFLWISQHLGTPQFSLF